MGQGAPCSADSAVSMVGVSVILRFVFRLNGDPDDPAHRIVIAEARVTGPEAENEVRVVGRAHWSGQPTEPGHEWDVECPIAWPGSTDGFYVGDAAYLTNNWNAIATTLTGNVFAEGSYAYASGPRELILDEMLNREIQEWLTIYSNLATDLPAVLEQPVPAPQDRITRVAAITNEVQALEGIRALSSGRAGAQARRSAVVDQH